MKLTIIAALWLLSFSAFAELAAVKSGVYRWAEHPISKSENRESRKILEGSSAHLDYLKIHASTQLVGAKPRPARANKDMEELIIVKEGLVKVTVNNKSEILGAGSVILLMPNDMHSLENVGDTPLTYFVMKYRSKKQVNFARGKNAGGSLVSNINALALTPSKRGAGRRYFDRPTAMCERFEMHTTQLHNKGPSHKPHAHSETEIILVLAGETEMTIDGKPYTATAGDFYFAESQLQHGISNTTDMPASYFAFKWH